MQRLHVDELIDEYRVALHDSLNGLTEEEARRRLVPSKTTLLGLIKHATFVEGVWFDQAITGRSYSDIGVAESVDASFTLRRTDRSHPSKRRIANGERRREGTSMGGLSTRLSTGRASARSGR